MESKAADVFAFAMLAVEIYTGKVPFPEQPPAMAASRVLKGERPEMPEDAVRLGLTTEIREFLERCWDQNPGKRPTTKEVVKKWQRFVDREVDWVVNDTQTFSIPVSTSLTPPKSTSPTTSPSLPQPGVPVPSESSLMNTNQKY